MIRQTAMIRLRQSAFALLGVAALACAGWTAASAQNTPVGSGPGPHPPAVGRGLAAPSRGLRPARKQCFWRAAQAGESFARSGTCSAKSSAAVGSRCGCYLKGRVHPGTVIAMPPFQVGPPPAVR